MLDLAFRTRIRQCVAIWVSSGVRLVGVVHWTSGPQMLPALSDRREPIGRPEVSPMV